MKRIEEALAHAKQKHPEGCRSLYEWVSVLTEEVGEFAKEVNDLYSSGSYAPLLLAEAEVAQVAAVAIRVLESIDNLKLVMNYGEAING